MAAIDIGPPRSHAVTANVPRQRTLGERGLLAVVALGALAVLGLWWHDTTVMPGVGEWLTAAGRLTGLLGGYTVAVVLLLMSRAPWIDHGLGTDRLARWHAMGGRYLLGLLTAHAVLITWGYALTANTGVLSQTRLLLVAVPDVLLATVGYGLLVLVGVLSARQVRRRVTYETWYLVHLLTYVAVGLSFLHVLSVGADFQTGWAKASWIALYGAVGSALLWFRWLVPVRDALRHQLRVSSVTVEAPGVVSVAISGRDLTRLGAKPGQFFRWRFFTSQGWWQSHPYSLSAVATDEQFRVTIKGLGDHSREMANLRPGVRVVAEGPYGAFTPPARRGRGVLLLAGGIGITPLRAMVEHLHAEPGPIPGPVTLVYRARTIHDLVFATELDHYARASHIDVRYALGATGSNTDLFVGHRLNDVASDLCDRDVYVCGPPAFMDAAVAALRRCGVPPTSIHSERFDF